MLILTSTFMVTHNLLKLHEKNYSDADLHDTNAKMYQVQLELNLHQW